jgi:Uma2 family endonuclease
MDGTERAMPLTQETFAALVLEDIDGRWVIHNQKRREKPPMSLGHNRIARKLMRRLLAELPEDEFDVLVNDGHLALPHGDSYIPDVAIVPIHLLNQLGSDFTFESYSAPLPLVVEVWSPSTGNYDVDAKVPRHQLRGDAEIWRIHPFERTLTAWRRQPDCSYVESAHASDGIALAALPEIAIDLDELFR